MIDLTADEANLLQLIQADEIVLLFNHSGISGWWQVMSVDGHAIFDWALTDRLDAAAIGLLERNLIADVPGMNYPRLFEITEAGRAAVGGSQS